MLHWFPLVGARRDPATSNRELRGHRLEQRPLHQHFQSRPTGLGLARQRQDVPGGACGRAGRSRWPVTVTVTVTLSLTQAQASSRRAQRRAVQQPVGGKMEKALGVSDAVCGCEWRGQPATTVTADLELAAARGPEASADAEAIVDG